MVNNHFKQGRANSPFIVVGFMVTALVLFAVLQVKGARAGCVPVLEGALAWWPGESNTWDVVGGYDGSFVYGPPPTLTYTEGKVGAAFRFIGGPYVQVPTAGGLDPGSGSGLTIEGWVRPDSYGIWPIADWSNGAGLLLGRTGPGVIEATLSDTNERVNIVTFRSAPYAVSNLVWQHVALAYDAASGMAAIYINGIVVAQTNAGSMIPNSSGDVYLGYITSSREAFRGALDEFTFYGRALTPSEIQSIVSADAAGKCLPPPLPCVTPPSGIVAWWRGESNAVDSVSGNIGLTVPTNFPTLACYQTGKVDAAFSFKGPNYVSIPRSDILDVGKAEGLTIEAWINPSQPRPMPILEWTDSNSFGASLWMSYYRGPTVLEANLIDTSGAFHLVQSPLNTLTYNAWQHVALTYDKTSGQASLYVNGNAIATTNLGSFTPRTYTDLLLGSHPRYTGQSGYGAPPPSSILFAGSMDEVAIYRRALAAGEIRTIVHSRPGKCLELPPTVGRSPMDEIALEGETARFDVTVGGTEPLSYQWLFEGAAISGADDPALLLTHSAMANAGNYSVIISNAFGSTTSRVARLIVLPANQCLPTPLGVVSFWRGESNVEDELGNHPASWTNTSPAYTNGLAGKAFRFNGVSYLQVPADPDLDVSAGGGFTVEGWIKPDAAPVPQAIVDWNDGKGNVGVGLMLSGPGGPGSLQVTLTDTNAVSSQEGIITFATPWWAVGSQTNPIPSWTHVALTFDKATGTSTLFVNGQSVAERTISPIRKRTSNQNEPFNPTTTGDLYFGWRRSGLYSGPRFRGAMDEMTVYYRALTPLEVQALYHVGSNGKCTPQSACLPPDVGMVSWWRGESNVLDSVGSNHGSNMPPHFYTNGVVGMAFSTRFGGYVEIPASPSLDVGSGPGLTFETWIKPDDKIPYTIAAWNNGNGEQGVSLGSSYTSGLSYLEVNFVDTQGNSHVLGPYRAITNRVWQHVATTYDKRSGNAVLYINGSPLTVTNLGVFTPRTTGNLYLGYRPPGPYPGSGWRFYGELDEISVYSRALSSGEITAHYRNASIRCMQPPVIMKQPASLRVNAGSDVTLSVEAVGNPVLRYQWFKDGKVIYDRNQRHATNANMSSLCLTSITKFNQGIYHVLITNAFGVARSSNAVLLVNYPPMADATATKSLLVVPAGCSPRIILDGSRSSDPDGDPLHYVWFKIGETIPFASGVVAVASLPLGTNTFVLFVDDGIATNAQTLVVELISPVQSVERLINLVNSQAQKPKPLVATLSAALASLQRVDVTPAINQLEAFENKVRSQAALEDLVLAGQFIQAAQDIVDALRRDCVSPKPHGKFGNVKRQTNGKLHMEFSAPDGHLYLIESSTNLVDWEKIGAAIQTDHGEYEFEAPSANHLPVEFYRVVVE